MAGFFLCLSFLLPLAGQRPNEERVTPGMDRIDRDEGRERLLAFRQQRLAGDYVFEFQLEHKPRRARTERYDGILWGTWNAIGALTRVRLFDGERLDKGASRSAMDWIVQNGPEASAWIRRGEDEAFQPITGEALFEPVLPGLNYSIFDLQMPFIHWPEFVYEGPVLVGATRVAQQFLMRPPDGTPFQEAGISAVRIGLDDTYNALLRIEVLDEAGEVRSRFQVESFQKVQEQYIVKKITLTDYPSKDRTTFHVTKAEVGLSLDPELFARPRVEAPAAVSGSPVKERVGSAGRSAETMSGE